MPRRPLPGGGGGTGSPLVRDVDTEAGRAVVEGDRAAGTRGGVFERVGECLLHDAVRGQLDDRWQRPGWPVTRKSAGVPLSRTRSISSGSAARLGWGASSARLGAYQAEQPAHLGQRSAAGGDDVGQRGLGPLRLPGEHGLGTQRLPDREADTLADWLRCHPGAVEGTSTASRRSNDRCTAEPTSTCSANESYCRLDIRRDQENRPHTPPTTAQAP
jgi:hypothetical protein